MKIYMVSLFHRATINEDKDTNRKRLIKSCKGNRKKFYSLMRKLQTNKAEIRGLVIDNGNSVTTCDAEAAQVLCDHFQQSFTSEKLVDDCMHDEMKPACSFSLSVDFDDAVVLEKLQHLKKDKSPGPDGLHPVLLNCCAQELCHPLSLIYQKSYDTGILPEDWKTASVCPVYKKGSRSDPGNYRPVSLTSILCKIMESVVCDTLLEFVTDKNTLTCYQHGFRKRRSCLTNLLETFEAWTCLR